MVNSNIEKNQLLLPAGWATIHSGLDKIANKVYDHYKYIQAKELNGDSKGELRFEKGKAIQNLISDVFSLLTFNKFRIKQEEYIVNKNVDISLYDSNDDLLAVIESKDYFEKTNFTTSCSTERTLRKFFPDIHYFNICHQAAITPSIVERTLTLNDLGPKSHFYSILSHKRKAYDKYNHLLSYPKDKYTQDLLKFMFFVNTKLNE